MAGLKGKSGPPGNMNAFKHGLAAIQKRREEGLPTQHEGKSVQFSTLPRVRRLHHATAVSHNFAVSATIRLMTAGRGIAILP
jgi:hypothetical protein